MTTRTVILISTTLLVLTGFVAATNPPDPVMVANIHPSGHASPQGLANVGKTVYFKANDGSTGDELWASDGTQVGTYRVRNINGSPQDSAPKYITAFDGKIYLQATNYTGNRLLWCTDGATIDSISISGVPDPEPEHLVAVDDLLFFEAGTASIGRQIYKLAAGTTTPVMVSSVSNGVSWGSSEAIAVGSLLFFSGDSPQGTRVFSSNGTSFTPIDVNGGGNYDPTQLTNMNDSLACFNVGGVELWKSNGTTPGSALVPLPGNPANANPLFIVGHGNNLFFQGENTSGERRLWWYNLSSVSEIPLSPSTSDPEPEELTFVGDMLFFEAPDGAGARQLWKVDIALPGSVGTAELLSSGFAVAPQFLTASSSFLYFAGASSTLGQELWRSDGTVAGTILVKDINASGSQSSSPQEFHDADGNLFFQANDSVFGEELWLVFHPLTLTTNVIGNGSVQKSPDQLTYSFNDVVMLTAIPDPGWTFDGWSDGLTGSENPESMVMESDTTVTATFTKDAYTLTVNVVGNGSVQKSPSQPTYCYNDSVTLTPMSDLGWTFNGWSDGLTGSENPDTVVIASDTTITANFVVGNTPAGKGVAVQPPDENGGGSPVKLTFDCVSEAGTTTLSISGAGPPPPNGFLLVPPVKYFELTTTATFVGNIEVCIDYSVFDPMNEAALKLLHKEGGQNGGWVDRTDTVDTVNDTICAIVTGFSPFTIGEYVGVTGIGDGSDLPKVTRLLAAYPVPFNPSVTIEFDVDRRREVRVAIFDVRGRLVRVLADGVQNAGTHKVSWDGNDDRDSLVATGVYFIKLVAGDTSGVRKIVMLK